MEEKRAYFCLARRIPGPTWFFSIYRPHLQKNAQQIWTPQVSHFYQTGDRAKSFRKQLPMQTSF